MMMMSGRLTFTPASAIDQELTSIYDLDIDSRELLRWFASAVCIDIHGNIRLTFDPNNGDYGSHHYGNYERLLDPLPRGYRYYTLGNINQQTLLQVPSQGRNKARLIVRIRVRIAGRQSQIIDQVYVTQHYQEFDFQRSEYNPDETYQITTSLLREIRGFPMAIHNELEYRASNFGSAYTSQSWGTVNMQAATRTTNQHDFSADEESAPDWLRAVVAVLILFIAVGTLFNLAIAT